MRSICLLIVFAAHWLMPTSCFAAVIINEVAWMGSELSANDEWIELYNNGSSPVSVDGWKLVDNQALEIELTGTIGAGAYAVLERTDDDSAPGTAFLIYTGALANTGATLALKRSDGGVEDQVAGGADWENIGGDNTTKETAQYTTAGWVTAVATPGAKNQTFSIKTEDDNETENTTTKSSTASNRVSAKPKEEKVEERGLTLKLTLPNVIYVNQPITMSVESRGLPEAILDSLVYSWNFGDLNTDRGKDVQHTYEYAGEYLLTVTAAYASHSEVVKQRVKILPVKFVLERNVDGDIMLENKAPYEVDISGYTLESAGPFKLPENTYLLPSSTITIPKEKLGAHKSADVYLRDQQGNVVASTEKVVSVREVTAEQKPQVFAPPSPTPNLTYQNLAPEVPETETNSISTTTSKQPSVLSAAAVNSGPVVPPEAWPYLGLIGLLSVGVFSIYYKGNQSN